jgi:hypothetical protein
MHDHFNLLYSITRLGEKKGWKYLSVIIMQSMTPNFKMKVTCEHARNMKICININERGDV